MTADVADLTHITNVAYDESAHTLSVRFEGGRTFVYANVRRPAWDHLRVNGLNVALWRKYVHPCYQWREETPDD